ncbi:uncharacterized protein LOC126907937 isoform X2 [Daktulosphaira vitifoliae]|uniref:uncharacterized protein LOC126907937 isoform X2 n=1 Tax=Daktulosphaira vitifoliae TaxID=58002 RepID=UPI0021AAA1F5|nr:uncharacterized protein LOC126907937 isoform X2 [Daktulosphaira vitifoliae]
MEPVTYIKWGCRSLSDEKVHCKSYHSMYENYIETVVNHIYSQIISYRKQDSNHSIGIEEAFQPNYNLLNFRQKYDYTISIINFKYHEILRKYLDLINLLLGHCQRFYNENKSSIHFISCVQFLEIVVNISKNMIENLHNAMKFISYIDIKFLFFEGCMVPHSEIHVIEFIHKYVLEKSVETNSFDLNKSPYEINLENLTKFYTDASIRVNNFFRNITNLNTLIINDLKEIKIAELSYDLNFLNRDILDKFFNEIIEVWYQNLGFEEFLNPKTDDFIPPIDPDTNQNDGIEALNIIRKESGWEKMNHISIVYFGKNISVDRIINDEVSNINFQIKKEHVSQLLRCRFTEIMKNYRTLISAFLYVCNKDAVNYYHICLIKLFSSFAKSKKMLKELYEALVTLNESSIWNVHLSSKSSLHKIFSWVAGFLKLLENNDFSLKNIVENKFEMVEQLLVIFKNHLNIFSDNLRSDLSTYDTRCSMDIKFENVKDYVSYFRNLGVISFSSNSELINQIIHNACNYFEKFFEYVSKSCYEDLGFEKLSHCKNKELDTKLLCVKKVSTDFI